MLEPAKSPNGHGAATRTPLLDGLRVLDISTDLAGRYATRLLADLGADVIKVESLSGDPMRSWSSSRAELDGRDGALFCFLNATKRSVIGDLTEPGISGLLAGADLLIESGQLTDEQIAFLRSDHPDLVITSVTPFGRSDPWAGRPATEFTLQALCGSTASRGAVEREPLHAGGRFGEWIAGTYTAGLRRRCAQLPGFASRPDGDARRPERPARSSR